MDRATNEEQSAIGRQEHLMRRVSLAGRRLNAVAVVVGLLGSGVMMLSASYAAFTSTTSNGANNWSAGTVNLTDDDGGLAMFTTGAPGANQVSSANMKPGATVVNCIRVTYNGNLPSTVKIYATSVSETLPNGTGMLSYLHTKIEEGTAGAFGCAGFATTATIWDSATHPGAASDLLSVFPATYAAGFATNQATWNNTNFRVFRFTMTLDAAAPDTSQAATATATFNWQAQNT
jgi:hypothetical protein